MSPLDLFAIIFLYNVLTFGNGPVMILPLQRHLVEQTGVLTVDQLLYAFTIAGITPGQANMYIASIGYMLFGISGAVMATAAIQLPGYLMIGLLKGYQRFQSFGQVRSFTRGLTCTSVGLMFAASFSIGRNTLTVPISWVVFALTLVLIYLLKQNILLSLAVASAAGALLHVWF